MAAGGSGSCEPKLPCPSTSVRLAHARARAGARTHTAQAGAARGQTRRRRARSRRARHPRPRLSVQRARPRTRSKRGRTRAHARTPEGRHARARARARTRARGRARAPDIKRLRHPDERVVHGRVAVRVVLAQHLADDAGALAVPPARREAELVHRVQDPPLHRLQAVADVRQRARQDHAHRVREVRALHLVAHVNLAEPADGTWRRRDAHDCALVLLELVVNVLVDVVVVGARWLQRRRARARARLDGRAPRQRVHWATYGQGAHCATRAREQRARQECSAHLHRLCCPTTRRRLAASSRTE